MAWSRQTELANFSANLRWLEPDPARHSYDYAQRFSSGFEYGLETAVVSHVERHAIASLSVACAWVNARVSSTGGSVQVVFGPSDVCVSSVSFYATHWPDLFSPSRDDALVIAAEGEWIMFHAHENKLEFGRRASE